MSQKTIQNIKSIIFALAIVIGTTYVSAAWTVAPANPPANNVLAPINVGGNDAGIAPYSQLKTGILTLMTLITPDLTVTNSNGTFTGIPAGSVLTAIGANTGKVGWQTLPGPTCTTTNTDYNFSINRSSGNNSGFDEKITLLEPASYTISGSGTYWNDGGGGSVQVYVNPTADSSVDIPSIMPQSPKKIILVGGTVRDPDPNSSSEMSTIFNGYTDYPNYSAPERQFNVYPWLMAIERHGLRSATYRWSVPTTSFTIASGSSGTLRYGAGQAGLSGTVSVRKNVTTCGSTGVSRIIAGTGVTISPSGGTGDVTVSASTPSVSTGTWCGSGYYRIGTTFTSAGTFLKMACLGLNPATSCPAGYTQMMYSHTYATLSDQQSNARSNMYTCTKN